MLEDTVILIVEGNEEHVDLIRGNLLLIKSDLDIIHLNNQQDVLDYFFGTNAGERIKDGKKYIVLLDISTSEGNGIETLQKFKQDTRTKRIPVIVLSETDDPEIVEQYYHLGCNTYIVKPTGRTHFDETIQSITHFLSVVETAFIQ